ncbi:MAG: hypothetical protein ACE5GZ_09155 [Gammaproteobacteria bacterium]
MERCTRPILLTITLSAVLSLQAGMAAGNEKSTDYKRLKNVKTVEEVVVTGSRIKKEWERQYKSVAGKRIFRGPYGDTHFIIAISQELKNRGEKKRVFTRGITMPHEYTSSSLDRYNYLIEEECGINNFKFYEGPDFTALGYIEGKREILFDVMTGGGPFSSPGIWGPYDQIIGKRHKMKMIMGDAKKDGLGMIKGGYAIGMKAALPSYELQEQGDLYGGIVKTTGQCLTDKTDKEAAERVLSGR